MTEINWEAQGINSRKLDYIAFKLGYFYDAHRAEADCLALLTILNAPPPDADSRGMKCLLESSQEAAYVFKALGASFEKKDVLKARGYAWDAEARVWHCQIVGAARARLEAQWLAADVYEGPLAASIHKLSALERYSSRVGTKIR